MGTSNRSQWACDPTAVVLQFGEVYKIIKPLIIGFP
jgi:hypothetical protein